MEVESDASDEYLDSGGTDDAMIAETNDSGDDGSDESPPRGDVRIGVTLAAQS